MSWMQKLYETYNRCESSIGKPDDQIPLLPICHTTQKAHIEITIDADGNFLGASVVPKKDARTIIPCTESSGGRTSGEAPHPLCDKLQYVAQDYLIYLMRPFEKQDIRSKFIHELKKKRNIDQLILDKIGKSIEDMKKMKKDELQKIILSSLNNWRLTDDDMMKIEFTSSDLHVLNENILGDISSFNDLPPDKKILIKRLILEGFYPEGISKISYYQSYLTVPSS